MSADARLFVPDVARLAGLKPGTVQVYHNAATLARRHDPGRETDWPPPPLMPEPDGYDYPPWRLPAGPPSTKPGRRRQSGARSPWWAEDTIRAWLAGRRDRRVRVPAR